MAWHGHHAGFLGREKILIDELYNFAHKGSQFFIQKSLFVQETNLIHYLKTVSDGIPSIATFNLETKNHAVQTLIQIIYPPLADYAKTAIAITQIVLIRITNVFLYTPLVLLLAIAGINKGLVDRYLRRINGGRESSLIYHYAKISIKPFIFWGSLLYVALPLPLTPTYFLLPCAIGTSCAVYLAVKTFKKYS